MDFPDGEEVRRDRGLCSTILLRYEGIIRLTFVSVLMPKNHAPHPIQRVSAYARASRQTLVRERGFSALEARGVFLTALTTGVLNKVGVFSPHRSHPCGVADEFRSVFGSAPSFMLHAESIGAEGFVVSEDVVNLIVEDPARLGWAYQFWNEEERDDSTWAISRRGESPEMRSVAAATQVFTEEYMASFIITRCVAGLGDCVQRGAASFFDPACGAGHFLSQVVRTLGMDTGLDALEIVSVAYGCDIDGDAVEVCRMVVLLELIRLRAPPLKAVWRQLQSQIQALGHVFGSLERASRMDLLERTYECVVTNPPYIGRRKMTHEMRAYLDAHYPDTAMDLCSAFMQRCVELTSPGGMLGLVTVDKWLRLKGHEALRTGGSHFEGLYKMLRLDTVCELGARAFSPWSSLHDGVGTALLTAHRAPAERGHVFHFVSCCDGREPRDKERLLSRWALAGLGGQRVLQDSLRDVAGSTRYVVQDGMPVGLRSSRRTVGDEARVLVGLQTNDDRRYVRYVWSVPPDKDRWLVHGKGGGYERWYGLNRFLLDWREGRPVFEREPKSGLRVERWFAEEGWTYSWFAHGALGLRRKEKGWSFGRAASSALFCDDVRLPAFLNSRVASLAVRRLGGKAQLPEGVVRSLPIPESLDAINPALVEAAVELKRMLVREEITDATYQPHGEFNPRRLIRAQALLLVVEGELERQVAECLKLSEDERRALDDVFGRPVAWNSRVGGDTFEDVSSLLSREMTSLRGASAAREGRGRGDVALLERIEAFFERRSSQVVSPRGLPATSQLEQLCRAVECHPFDAEDALSSLVLNAHVVQREVLAPPLHARIIGEMLSLLGHQWWSSTDRYDASLHEERSAAEIADCITRRMGSFDPSAVLGEELQEWIATKAARYQSRFMYNTQLLKARVMGRSGDVVFSHVWGGSSSERHYCL